MPSKKYKCTKCDRSFSMAGHLGRHMSTIHAAPGAKKARKVKGRRRSGAGRPTGLTTRLGLRDMSLDQLKEVIDAARDQGRVKMAELRATFG